MNLGVPSYLRFFMARAILELRGEMWSWSGGLAQQA